MQYQAIQSIQTNNEEPLPIQKIHPWVHDTSFPLQHQKDHFSEVTPVGSDGTSYQGYQWKRGL
jgi:hypothetical protein